jgi:hypothetical protein
VTLLIRLHSIWLTNVARVVTVSEAPDKEGNGRGHSQHTSSTRSLTRFLNPLTRVSQTRQDDRYRTDVIAGNVFCAHGVARIGRASDWAAFCAA